MGSNDYSFFGSSLVTNTEDKRKVQGKGFLIKVLFTNTSYIRRSCLLECDSEAMDKENKCSAKFAEHLVYLQGHEPSKQ